MNNSENIIDTNECILITGSNGFIGSRVVEMLLRYGYTNLRCFVRPSSNLASLERIVSAYPNVTLDIIKGNLQSRDDCSRAAEGARIVYHLAAGRGEKSYPDAYMNSVVTTRNLLDALLHAASLKRFVNISSFAVYSNRNIRRGGLLDESCELEPHPHLTGEAYCYAKLKQEELVAHYGKRYNIPYVIIRPGVVYGPGNKGLTGRVGIGTFGIFLHLGGSNRIPLSYVDNCADAIVLAGLQKGIDGEVFNVVDDNLPKSRAFLRNYKKHVRKFSSIYLPHAMSYFLCHLWEWYSAWSEGQLPPTFNRKRWSNYWKGNSYSNEKLKRMLNWRPKIHYDEASMHYFDYQRKVGG